MYKDDLKTSRPTKKLKMQPKFTHPLLYYQVNTLKFQMSQHELFRQKKYLLKTEKYVLK